MLQVCRLIIVGESKDAWHMSTSTDTLLFFHEALGALLDSFRNVIVSLTWLKASVEQAQAFFSPHPYAIELTCTATDQLIKIDKSILTLVQQEGFNQNQPLYLQTLIGAYRVFTIAAKDIVWQESDFHSLLQRDELQFLRHIRNASAHHNKFFFGSGRHRQETLDRLPIAWRGKVIEERLEGTQLYLDYMAPGDLFVLLSDVSVLASHR